VALSAVWEAGGVVMRMRGLLVGIPISLAMWAILILVGYCIWEAV
jgi:hypothetical protein